MLQVPVKQVTDDLWLNCDSPYESNCILDCAIL